MIVAITGGTGFIGRKLALRCLAQGDEVRILSRYEPDEQWKLYSANWYRADLGDVSGLSSFVDGVDVLFHCAGQLTDETMMYQLHVSGTQNLVDAASGRIKHWVQLSSVGVYGPISEGVVTEDSPLNPMGEYEVTKAESDRIVLDAAKRGAFSCSVLRPSNVFGADMKNQSLFRMIDMIERGLFFFIGKRGASANYIHVDNVVEGLLLCAVKEEARGKAFNLSDYSTIERFVQIISDALECNSPQLRMPERFARLISKSLSVITNFPLTQSRIDALSNRSLYSIDRIQKCLGYSHVISMGNALQQLVAAYKSRE